MACLLQFENIGYPDIDNAFIRNILQRMLDTKEWVTQKVYESKAKDYKNSFRNMVYDSKDEMESVVGTLDDNGFIKEQKEELSNFKLTVQQLMERFK